ncbi:MAG: YdcF family protein [Methylocystis sp.]
MFFILSKIFEFFATPTNLALFIGALGVTLTVTRYRRTGCALSTGAIVLLLLMGFSPLAGLLAVPLETRFPPLAGDAPAPDGIIVLGGSVDENLSGVLNRVTLSEAAERLTAPIALKREYPAARLVFTGGTSALRGSPYTEAETVRKFWREVGLDRGDVLYEDKSRNTFENAVFTRDLVQPKPGERWLLVTSAMHMPRSIGIFRKAGFPVIAYPVDYRTTGEIQFVGMPRHASRSLSLLEFAAHEWVGLLAYRLTGKTDALFPAP